MNNKLVLSQKLTQQHLSRMFKQHKKMIREIHRLLPPTQGLTFEQVLKPFLKHKNNKKYHYCFEQTENNFKSIIHK